jgi:hypothetical protein
MNCFWGRVFRGVRDPTYEMCERAVLHNTSLIKYVPDNHQTEHLYACVGCYCYSYKDIKYIPIDKMTQKISIYIALNTRLGYDEEVFETKLKLIPDKFKISAVYYYLIKNMVVSHLPQDIIIKCFEKIPVKCKKKVMTLLLNNTQIIKYINNDMIDKIMKNNQ